MTQGGRTGLKDLFTTWLGLGIQSFGGGSSTYFLIHKTCVDRGWMTDAEIVRTWALVQISPGIHLIKLTVLIGHRLRGWRGVVAAMAGLLLPSSLVTALMTAGFAAVRSQPLVQAAMRGILPATIGLSFAASVRMGRPLLTQAHREGGLRLGVHLVIAAGAALLLAAAKLSPVFVILSAGAAALLALALIPVAPAPDQGGKGP